MPSSIRLGDLLRPPSHRPADLVVAARRTKGAPDVRNGLGSLTAPSRCQACGGNLGTLPQVALRLSEGSRMLKGFNRRSRML